MVTKLDLDRMADDGGPVPDDPFDVMDAFTPCTECGGAGGFVHRYGPGEDDGEAEVCGYCEGSGVLPAASSMTIESERA